MNLDKIRIKSENDSQTRIIMLLLQELGGKMPPSYTIDSYIRNYSSAEFPKLMKEKTSQIKIGEHLVEFKENGVQVGCTFVEKETVKKIHERLFGKQNSYNS